MGEVRESGRLPTGSCSLGFLIPRPPDADCGITALCLQDPGRGDLWKEMNGQEKEIIGRGDGDLL
jgi:hypothetical protein